MRILVVALLLGSRREPAEQEPRDTDRALESIEPALVAEHSTALYGSHQPALAELRSEPRVSRSLQCMGLRGSR